MTANICLASRATVNVPEIAHGAAASARHADAVHRLLGWPQPPAARPPTLLSDGTVVTTRLRYGPVRASLPAAAAHLVVAHCGEAREISGRIGAVPLAALARPGTITVVPAGRAARLAIDGTVEASHVLLDDARLQAAATRVAGTPVALVGRVACADPAAAAILELLGREAALDGPAARPFLEQAVELLCMQLVRGHSSLGDLAARPPRRGLADWQVRRATAYMRDHLDEAVGLGTLASLVGLSRFHFCTAFRLATGSTPHEWLVAQRIGRARQLLADPAVPVTEIALAVGYATPSAFAAAFRRTVGLSPSAFRRTL